MHSLIFIFVFHLNFFFIQSEQEAAALLPEGYSLEEGIYGPIRAAIDATLAAANGTATTVPAASASGVSEGESAGLTSSVSTGDMVGGGVSSASEGASVAAPVALVNPGEVEAGEITEPNNTNITTTTAVDSSIAPQNYYHHLDTIDSMVNSVNAAGNSLSTITAFHNTNAAAPVIGEDGEVIVDEAGEKMLMSEIEKFRLRQMQRDK